jgi:hypothetical protein
VSGEVPLGYNTERVKCHQKKQIHSTTFLLFYFFTFLLFKKMISKVK